MQLRPKPSMAEALVELPKIDDYYAWAFEQAASLRAGRFDLDDLANVIDELEALGRAEFRSFRSNIKIVLTHLLKWDFQPDNRGLTGENSIGDHRDRIEEDQRASPSMMGERDDAVKAAYDLARGKASRETRMSLSSFPEACPYTWEQIMHAPYELNRD